MIIPSEILDIISTTSSAAPALLAGSPAAAAPAAGDNRMGMAIGAVFITLILMNNAASDNLKLALLVGIGVYFFMKPKADDHH